ncbi:Pr6Pr family membrane protein [Nitratireductor luteus]|uniref:Pr6Pr family membrane protein n=1 Tax=Nitratireductor luteus TaxID=2976980 RepID=UPI00223E9824|nr:Pr6Pr family membrane protein [Nitratireductor luteus]
MLILNFTGFVIGVFALVLQFVILMPVSMAAGHSLGGSIVYYFSFFTILTNILVVLTHLAALIGRPAFFRRARARGGVAVAIAAVGLVYYLLLSDLWRPQGLFLLCDLLLHYVTPALFLTWWLLAGADGSLRWRDILYWLAYPVLYLLYLLARAPIAGEVPYVFLDVGVLGIGKVLLIIGGIALLFVLLSAVTVMADRVVGVRRKAARAMR